MCDSTSAVAGLTLRRQIEEIIHSIANQERLELSGREQLQLADEIADDMTGYGPLRPLLIRRRTLHLGRTYRVRASIRLRDGRRTTRTRSFRAC